MTKITNFGYLLTFLVAEGESALGPILEIGKFGQFLNLGMIQIVKP